MISFVHLPELNDSAGLSASAFKVDGQRLTSKLGSGVID